MEFHGSLLQKLYNDPTFCDVTLTFEGHSIPAHKTILKAASPVFNAAFNGNWSNATTKEFHIEGHVERIILDMIKYIYGFPLSVEDMALRERGDYYLDMYMIAVEYTIPSLKAAVTGIFEEWLSIVFDKCPSDSSEYLEKVISLYNSHDLGDALEDKNALIAGVARFCVVFTPRWVERKCDCTRWKVEDRPRMRERYGVLIKQLHQQFRYPLLLMDGKVRWDYYRWGQTKWYDFYICNHYEWWSSDFKECLDEHIFSRDEERWPVEEGCS